MNELKEYIIAFKGLSVGEHIFHFQVTQKFFEAMQSPDIYPTDIQVNLKLDYRPGLMTFYMEGSGKITFPCDRCLEEFDFPISYNRTVVYKTGEAEGDDDDVIFISPNDSQVDISQLIYDDILTSIPIRKVHPLNEDGTDSCNPEQIAFLEKQSSQKPVDHRWDALKDLKFDD